MRIVFLLLLLLSACKEDAPTGPAPTPSVTAVVVTTPATTPPILRACEVEPTTVALKWGSTKLPKTGTFVLESHLATKEDKFGTRLFPRNTTEDIQAHLDRACAELKKLGADCSKVYATKYHKEWTPPEGGKAGQGSVGDTKPTVIEEMWTCNMMWTKAPKAGTKFLATYKGKSVVVVMGYETGPGSSKWLGGCQGEVLWALGADDTSQITLMGTLKDQGIPAGPISCN